MLPWLFVLAQLPHDLQPSRSENNLAVGELLCFVCPGNNQPTLEIDVIPFREHDLSEPGTGDQQQLNKAPEPEIETSGCFQSFDLLEQRPQFCIRRVTPSRFFRVSLYPVTGVAIYPAPALREGERF